MRAALAQLHGNAAGASLRARIAAVDSPREQAFGDDDDDDGTRAAAASDDDRDLLALLFHHVDIDDDGRVAWCVVCLVAARVSTTSRTCRPEYVALIDVVVAGSLVRLCSASTSES